MLVRGQEPCFWADGLLATELDEVSNDLSRLDEPGFWAVAISFEGEVNLARFKSVVASQLPNSEFDFLPTVHWSSSLSKTEYESGVEFVRNEISKGNVYQVNLCRILSAEISTNFDGLALANSLFHHNPAPFFRYLRIPEVEIMSASPERFLSREGKQVKTSPIKGTASSPDEMLAKDHAENIMIVDLMRNDLGRISEPGSVHVSRLLGMEAHPGLVHLVSDVESTLRKDTKWLELANALLPPGSVSGAPKSSAVEIIKQLEKTPRDIYCGVLGWVDNRTDKCKSELSVAIRTFWRRGEILKFGTGAGITWGSDPTQEWEETELKAKRLIGIAEGSIR